MEGMHGTLTLDILFPLIDVEEFPLPTQFFFTFLKLIKFT